MISVMSWSKVALKPRVERRAAQLNKSMSEVLPTGYAFFAPTKAEQSPTISTLETIAGNLEWSLCELLCESNTRLIKIAVTAALRAVPSDRAELIPEATISAFDLLNAYESDQQPIDEANLAHIERSLRAQYKGR